MRTWKLTPTQVARRTGSNSCRWKGGRKIDNEEGYILLLRPNHPHCQNDGYIFEHRLVMEQHLGRYLKKCEVVHHIDGDKSNNRIKNLMLFPNMSAHHKFRHSGASTFVCKHCGKEQ